MHSIRFLWRRQPAHLATLSEERFERTGGLDSHQQRPRVVADVRPDVRDHAGHEQRITRAQREPLVADLEGELALDRIEPLVLLVVEMSRRPAFTHVGVLEDEESPIGIISGDLDLQRDDAPDHHLFLKAVLATWHVEPLLRTHVSSFPKFSAGAACAHCSEIYQEDATSENRTSEVRVMLRVVTDGVPAGLTPRWVAGFRVRFLGWVVDQTRMRASRAATRVQSTFVGSLPTRGVRSPIRLSAIV